MASSRRKSTRRSGSTASSARKRRTWSSRQVTVAARSVTRPLLPRQLDGLAGHPQGALKLRGNGDLVPGQIQLEAWIGAERELERAPQLLAGNVQLQIGEGQRARVQGDAGAELDGSGHASSVWRASKRGSWPVGASR